jgi:hypothetical protein
MIEMVPGLPPMAMPLAKASEAMLARVTLAIVENKRKKNC